MILAYPIVSASAASRVKNGRGIGGGGVTVQEEVIYYECKLISIYVYTSVIVDKRKGLTIESFYIINTVRKLATYR